MTQALPRALHAFALSAVQVTAFAEVTGHPLSLYEGGDTYGSFVQVATIELSPAGAVKLTPVPTGSVASYTVYEPNPLVHDTVIVSTAKPFMVGGLTPAESVEGALSQFLVIPAIPEGFPLALYAELGGPASGVAAQAATTTGSRDLAIAAAAGFFLGKVAS